MTCNIVRVKECAFLKKIIESFEKVLPFIGDEKYGKMLFANINFESSKTDTAVYTLNSLGSMMLLYGQVTSKPLPKVYTPDDINLINQIWDYLGHPENKIFL